MNGKVVQELSKLNRTDRWLDSCAIGFAVLGSIGVMALMIVTLVAVVWRYGFNAPIIGIGDLSVVMLSIVAAASVVYSARNNSHVSVNIIGYFFERKVTRFTDLIMRILTVGILGVAGYALFKKACGFEKACITENLSLQHWPYYYVLSIALGFYCCHIFVQLIQGLRRFNAQFDPNEMGD